MDDYSTCVSSSMTGRLASYPSCTRSAGQYFIDKLKVLSY